MCLALPVFLLQTSSDIIGRRTTDRSLSVGHRPLPVSFRGVDRANDLPIGGLPTVCHHEILSSFEGWIKASFRKQKMVRAANTVKLDADKGRQRFSHTVDCNGCALHLTHEPVSDGFGADIAVHRLQRAVDGRKR